MTTLKTDPIPVVAPCVHPNGTGEQELLYTWQALSGQLYDTLQALQHCSPHGRDYHVGDVSLEEAQAQHLRWAGYLQEIRRGAEQVSLLILDGRQRGEIKPPT